MATAKTNAIEEGQIRALIDERVKAVRTKDVDAGMSSIAPDILSDAELLRRERVGTARALPLAPRTDRGGAGVARAECRVLGSQA